MDNSSDSPGRQLKKCAEAGLKVLMIERSENDGDKVISGLTIPIYGFLFGPDFIRDGNPPFERPTDGITHRGIIDEVVNFIQKPFSVKGLAGKVREALDIE